jgi:multidrug efflux pump subunit AcrA (membrane-fusion protein)
VHTVHSAHTDTIVLRFQASVVADQPVPVKVRLPNQVQQAVSVLAGGAVEGNVTAMTAFEVSGRVMKVYVEEGQQVKKGQVLAELEPADYQHTLMRPLPVRPMWRTRPSKKP